MTGFTTPNVILSAARLMSFDELAYMADGSLDRDATRRFRLYSADCAARVLKHYEAENPGDERPRRAIEAARELIRGEIGPAKAAEAATGAWDAYAGGCSAASRQAARAAWFAVSTKPLEAIDAAWASYRAASVDGFAERVWQYARLLARMSDPEPADWPLDEVAITD